MPKRPSPESTEIQADPRNDRRQRRRWSAERKLQILEEYDALDRGERAALLRREGIYSSHISHWRLQLQQQGVDGLQPKTPGRKAKQDVKDRRIAHLEKKAAKLERELEIARKVIDLQVKAHEILGVALPRIEDE